MSSSSSDAMGADNLYSIMSQSLSTDGSTPQNPYAAIALLSHACMLAVGFRLVGLGEDHKIEAQSDSSDVQRLPSEWDQHSTYAFRYKHSQSSMEYLVKVTRLGGKAIVYGLGLGHDKTVSFEIKADDYVSEGSIKDTSDTDVKQILQNIFISRGRITDLASKFRSEIIQKLAPGIQKEGYQESSQTQTADRHIRPEVEPDRGTPRAADPPPARPYPFDDPLAMPPRRPGPVADFPPPGFEDEHELNQPPRGMGPGLGQPFGNIGERDLYPPGLGPHDPLRIGPGGGGFRGGGGGGMHPTFDDPIFGGGQGTNGYNPRAPPGARYDPVGPGDGPPNLRGGPRFPGGRGGGAGGGFGGPPNPFSGFGSGDFI